MSVATETLRRDIADIVEIPAAEVSDDAVLADLGLDSMRMMTLIEKWRGDGADVDFADLAPLPTVGDWIKVISTS